MKKISYQQFLVKQEKHKKQGSWVLSWCPTWIAGSNLCEIEIEYAIKGDSNIIEEFIVVATIDEVKDWAPKFVNCD